MAHRKTLYANSLNHINHKQFPPSIAVLSLPFIINTCIQTITHKKINQSIFRFTHLFWQKFSSSGGRFWPIGWLKYGRKRNTNTITYKNWHFKFKFPVTTESA